MAKTAPTRRDGCNTGGADREDDCEAFSETAHVEPAPRLDAPRRVAAQPGGFAFASALFSGASLAEAAAARADEEFDPGAHLVGLIAAGAFRALR